MRERDDFLRGEWGEDEMKIALQNVGPSSPPTTQWMSEWSIWWPFAFIIYRERKPTVVNNVELGSPTEMVSLNTPNWIDVPRKLSHPMGRQSSRNAPGPPTLLKPKTKSSCLLNPYRWWTIKAHCLTLSCLKCRIWFPCQKPRTKCLPCLKHLRASSEIMSTYQPNQSKPWWISLTWILQVMWVLFSGKWLISKGFFTTWKEPVLHSKAT